MPDKKFVAVMPDRVIKVKNPDSFQTKLRQMREWDPETKDIVTGRVMVLEPATEPDTVYLAPELTPNGDYEIKQMLKDGNRKSPISNNCQTLLAINFAGDFWEL